MSFRASACVDLKVAFDPFPDRAQYVISVVRITHQILTERIKMYSASGGHHGDFGL